MKKFKNYINEGTSHIDPEEERIHRGKAKIDPDVHKHIVDKLNADHTFRFGVHSYKFKKPVTHKALHDVLTKGGYHYRKAPTKYYGGEVFSKYEKRSGMPYHEDHNMSPRHDPKDHSKIIGIDYRAPHVHGD